MTRKSIRLFIIFALLVCTSVGSLHAYSGPLLSFFDDFEVNQGWGMFEEIVGGSNCYGAGLGEVALSSEVARKGAASLGVWANSAFSTKSNHVIAQKKLADRGQTGRFRYQVYAYIAPGTSSFLGETGPEFSMQNTRELSPGVFRTSTAGIQYRANPYSPLYRSWGVWAEADGALGQAEWQTFMTTDALVPGEWYFMELEADYRTNRYGRFSLRGRGIHLSINLSHYRIAPEVKFAEQAFWLTLESENLYNNCGTAGSYSYKVYYDEVALRHFKH